MKELVIGADGYIGSRLVTFLKADGTSRRNPTLARREYFLDLLSFEDSDLPEYEIVYMCAAVNGAQKCEGNQESYRVNVDATLRVLEHYKGQFVVWVSSTTVEWANTAYSRHKQIVESACRHMPWVSVVRAGRVVNSNLESLCQTLAYVGRNKKPGLTLWGIDEKPYDK